MTTSISYILSPLAAGQAWTVTDTAGVSLASFTVASGAIGVVTLTVPEPAPKAFYLVDDTGARRSVVPYDTSSAVIGDEIAAIAARLEEQVPGDGSVVVIPAATDADQTIAYGVTRTAGGTPETGIEVVFQLESPASEGGIYGKEIKVLSATDGQIIVPLVKGARYRARRGAGSWKFFTTGSTGTFELPSFVGV